VDLGKDEEEEDQWLRNVDDLLTCLDDFCRQRSILAPPLFAIPSSLESLSDPSKTTLDRLGTILYQLLFVQLTGPNEGGSEKANRGR